MPCRRLFLAGIAVWYPFRTRFEATVQPHILLWRHPYRVLNRPVHLRRHGFFIAALQRLADILKNNQFVT